MRSAPRGSVGLARADRAAVGAQLRVTAEAAARHRIGARAGRSAAEVGRASAAAVAELARAVEGVVAGTDAAGREIHERLALAVARAVLALGARAGSRAIDLRADLTGGHADRRLTGTGRAAILTGRALLAARHRRRAREVGAARPRGTERLLSRAARAAELTALAQLTSAVRRAGVHTGDGRAPAAGRDADPAARVAADLACLASNRTALFALRVAGRAAGQREHRREREEHRGFRHDERSCASLGHSKKARCFRTPRAKRASLWLGPRAPMSMRAAGSREEDGHLRPDSGSDG